MIQPHELFEVLVVEEPDRAVLALLGELDISTAPALDAAIDRVLANGSRDLVLDLSGLDFLDSTGLGVIARTLRKLQPDGHRLVLRGAQPKTRKVLELTGMTGLFDLEH